MHDDDARAHRLRAFLASAAPRTGGAAVVALDDLHLRRGVVEPTGEPRFCLAQLAGCLVERLAQRDVPQRLFPLRLRLLELAA